MHKYKGKAKCFCGKRAKYRTYTRMNGSKFACEEHKHTIDEEDYIENTDYTEADYQTWLRL